MFYIDFSVEKKKKIFLSETRKPRLLIFGIKHHLVKLYQVCSIYIPWAKNGTALGVTCSTLAYIGKM